MERLFVAQCQPFKSLLLCLYRTALRNFLAQSFSPGGLYALLSQSTPTVMLNLFHMTVGQNIPLFVRPTASEKIGKTMLGMCGCRASGFSLSKGLEWPGRDKNEAHVLPDFVDGARVGIEQRPARKEAFGLT